MLSSITFAPRPAARLAHLDFVGSALSTLCAIHCLAMPFVAGLLPVLGLNLLGDRAFERAACVTMTALATFCLLRGCQRHRRWWLLGLLAAGASLTLGTQFIFAADTAATCAKACCSEAVNWSQALVMFAGGGLIAASHILNLIFDRACSCCAKGSTTVVLARTSPSPLGIKPCFEDPPRFWMMLLMLASLLAPSAWAAHSDIILSRSNGGLLVDYTIHTGDLRENDVAGDGTVWATDNPGFAGSGFKFQDSIEFDITGPLQLWNGDTWASTNVTAEVMEFIEPGPFGPANLVTIRRDQAFVPGYRIAETGTRGSIHTHYVFVLRATNGLPPALGAYSFPLTLRSPQYASAPPVHLVFNNGLSPTAFAAAVDQFRAAQEMRLTLHPRDDVSLALSHFTIEGRTNRLLSAVSLSGPWIQEEEPFVGHGGLHEAVITRDSTAKFFRVTRE